MLLYVEGKVGDFTVYLEQPIKKPRSVSLRGCVFINHCKNLPKEGTVSDVEGNIILRIPPGCYTIKTLKQQIDKAMFLGEKPVNIEESTLEVLQHAVLNDSLLELLGLKTNRLRKKTRHEIRLKTLETIFLHCDLVSASDVLKEGMPSQILARVEVDKGVGEKIIFDPNSPIQLRATSVDYVNSLRFRIVDGDGNLIENIYPIRTIVEIT